MDSTLVVSHSLLRIAAIAVAVAGIAASNLIVRNHHQLHRYRMLDHRLVASQTEDMTVVIRHIAEHQHPGAFQLVC